MRQLSDEELLSVIGGNSCTGVTLVVADEPICLGVPSLDDSSPLKSYGNCTGTTDGKYLVCNGYTTY